MQNVKYVFTLFIAMCFALIEGSDFKDHSTLTAEEINIPPEKSREINATLVMGERNHEVEDENKPVRILIFEGAEFRVALRDKNKVWENARVPFEIAGNYSRENRNFIMEVMNEFHNKTCVRFTPRKEEKSYIFIMPGTGCSSAIGKTPQSNTVTLNENCFAKGIVIHELMHTLGFLHEQNRPDRDKFVKIMFENIKEGFEADFRKFSEDEATTMNQTYDYGSVMHYGAFDFTKNMMPTITTLKEGVKIGQRDGFSELDLVKINTLYNCNGTSIKDNRTLEDDEGITGNRELEDEGYMDNREVEHEGFPPLEDAAKKTEKIKKNPILYYASPAPYL